MYNLRFYLDDNDRVIKCDYKQIPRNGELDLIFYDEIVNSKKELYNAFSLLARHDMGHKNTIHPNYILHEFTVPEGIIKDMLDRMKKYKAELANSHKVIQLHENTKKFTPRSAPVQSNRTTTAATNKKTTPSRKYKLKRENKYKNRRAIVSIVALIALSSTLFGAVKATSNAIEKAKDAAFFRDAHVVSTEVTNEVVDEPITISYADTVQQTAEENKFDYSLDIYAEDWTDTQKYQDCYNYYYPTIERYANMYGIDPRVALAIGCHERGVHSSEIDSGGGLGLYQIQVEVWDGHSVRAFNFETNEWEEYTIEVDNIRNVEENIKAGMMIFQDCLRRDDYNLAMAVQEYNFGHGGLLSSIEAASNSLGVSVETLEQNDNLEWLNYRIANVSSDGYQMGDPEYVENVFKYVKDGEILKFKVPAGEDLTVKYDNLNFDKDYSLS